MFGYFKFESVSFIALKHNISKREIKKLKVFLYEDIEFGMVKNFELLSVIHCNFVYAHLENVLKPLFFLRSHNPSHAPSVFRPFELRFSAVIYLECTVWNVLDKC